MKTQRRTFSVVRGGVLGEDQGNHVTLLQQDLEALRTCQVTGTKLILNYVFGCIDRPIFLVNLKNKATGRLVDSVVKKALGAHFDATPVKTVLPGEKFAPGRRKSTHKSDAEASAPTGETPIKATIERHAEQTLGASDGRAVLLGVSGSLKHFLYNRKQSLVPITGDMRAEGRVDEGDVLRPLDDASSSSSTTRDKNKMLQTRQDTPQPASVESIEHQFADGKARTESAQSASTSAQLMETQRRTFGVVLEGDVQDNRDGYRTFLESVLKRLTDCRVVGKKLYVNYVFGCVGHARFLVNLRTKATGRLADSIVKNALGPFWHATPFETRQLGEKFVPGRSLRKRRTTAPNAKNKPVATIQREAARTFGASDGMALLLAPAGKAAVYLYDRVGGLVLQGQDVYEDMDIDVGGGAGPVEVASFPRQMATGSSGSLKENLLSQARTCSPHQRLSGSTTCMSDASDRSGTEDAGYHADFREHDVPSHPHQPGGDASIEQSGRPLKAQRTADVSEAPSVRSQGMLRERGVENEVPDRPARAGANSPQIGDISETNGVQETHRRVRTHPEQGLHSRHAASVSEGEQAVEDVTSRNVQPSMAVPETDGGNDSNLTSRLQHGERVPHLFTSDPVAMLADSGRFSRIAAHGIFSAGHIRSGRVSESCADDGGGRARSESKEKTGTVRRPSNGMPAKKLVASRWREDNKQKYGTRGPPRPFPVDLFEILRTEDPAVIGWSNAQRPLSSLTPTTERADQWEEGFSIRDPERFCNDIIPRYFNQMHQYYPLEFPERLERFGPSQATRMLQVFEVELGLHGFRKVTRFNAGGRDAVSYVLATFKNGRPELLAQIQRSAPFEDNSTVAEKDENDQQGLTTGERSQEKSSCTGGRVRTKNACFISKRVCCPRCAERQRSASPSASRVTVGEQEGNSIGSVRAASTDGQSLVPIHRQESKRVDADSMETRVMFRMGEGHGSTQMSVLESPTAAEAAELLRRSKRTLDEVIAILSAAPKDGEGFKDVRACYRFRRPEAPWSCPGLRADERWESKANSAVDCGDRCDSSSLAAPTAQKSPVKAPTTPEDKRGDSDGCDLMQRSQNQYSSINGFRCALARVLQHLGFRFDDSDKGQSTTRTSCSTPTAGGAGFGAAYLGTMTWGGPTAMTFEEKSKDFRENLQQIPISWRSSLSRIVSCLEMDSSSGGTKNGNRVLDEIVEEQDDDDDGELQDESRAAGDIHGIVEMGVSRKRKRDAGGPEHRASLKVLQSVMKDIFQHGVARRELLAETAEEEEAMEAAVAAHTIDSMSRSTSPTNFRCRDVNGDLNGERGYL